MSEFLFQNKEYILIVFSVSCIIFLILWIIFLYLYLKKKNAFAKLALQDVEHGTWRALKERELESQRETIAALTDEKFELARQNERLKADTAGQEKYFKEQIDFLQKNKDELATKFQNISNEIIRAQNATFHENQKTTLDLLLKPFAEQMAEFKKKMDASHDDSVKFDEQIKNLFELNKSLNKEAENLANALKGNKKIQGNWGEFQLERVLEISGLQKGINYFCQETLKNEEAKTLRPDVIVRLPDNRQVIIDSKVSLNDYVTFVNASDEAVRLDALKRHIANIKKHVDELSSKEYQKLLKDQTLDYVVIFIPIEGAYVEAARADLSLYDYAFSKNIAITTPSSLLPLLKTIENLWQLDKRNKNAAEIALLGGKIYDKLAGFVDEMKLIDKSLNTAQAHYQDAMVKLAGKGGAISFAAQLKEKGSKVNKIIEIDNKNKQLLEFEERVSNDE